MKKSEPESTPASRIALGSAQFGTKYGIANKLGDVDQISSCTIIRKAQDLGVLTIDTAKNYKNCEALLGKCGVNSFDIVTKVPNLPDNYEDIDKWLNIQVNDSLQKLNITNLYGLLLHNTKDLFSNVGVKIFSALQDLKNTGQVKKIGISVYDPLELEKVFDKFQFDLVQLPLNIIDRRFEASGWLYNLNKNDIEIHARSIFLQGLLLLPLEELPRNFKKYEDLWKTYHAFLLREKINPLVLCLNYPINLNEISKIVIGVESVSQLSEIFYAINANGNSYNSLFMKSDDIELINPSLWNNS